MRRIILQKLYKLFPFDLTGDCVVPPAKDCIRISYVINFFGLKGRYSWPVWLLLLANCARHAPLFMLPARRYREQGRFGIGFVVGVLDGIRGSKEQVYG